MRSTVLVLTLVLVHSFAVSARSVPSAPLRFHLTPRGGVIVHVFLDANGPFPFLIDTGSNGSAISTTLASRLALPAVAKTTTSSVSGQVGRLVTRIEQLTIGGVVSTGVLATLTPAEELAMLDEGADGQVLQGIVGQDVLATLRYTIDYRQQRIIWRDTTADIPRNAAVLALEPRDDRFLVVLPQDQATIRLVPDSGSEALVLFRRGGWLPRIRWSDERVTMSGLAGRGEAEVGRVDALRIGEGTLKDVRAVIVDEPATPAASDGLLPLHLFARVTFNGPERQLVIEQR